MYFGFNMVSALRPLQGLKTTAANPAIQSFICSASSGLPPNSGVWGSPPDRKLQDTLLHSPFRPAHGSGIDREIPGQVMDRISQTLLHAG